MTEADKGKEKPVQSSSPSPVINLAALEPLYQTFEEPCRYRSSGESKGDPAQIIQGRRPSYIPIAQNLRRPVREWRESDYPGASDTSRELLHFWFGEEHLRESDSQQIPFRYYFCQREAIETFIYLYEVRGIRTLSSITAEFLGEGSYDTALGVNPDDDRWPKYAFKMATGSGKTKVMSLAIVWSYFHSLREEGSALARDFLIIAPNIIVFERLKEDFGDGKIFEADPLIPEAWKGDWNISVVLQDEASGAATGGRIYLTNIHRLYDTSKRRNRGLVESHDWLGPAVSRARALDTGEALRERVTSHRRIMVLNDEAHHLWDPDSAWNDAIEYVHQTIHDRSGGEIVSQLDFSATPKDNHGHIFQHVICDTPLGEAVDAGIVKIPVIGRGDGLVERPSDNAADRFQQHLMIGYKRWQLSKEEWEKSGKKALLFIMAENTEAADQIARELNTSSMYSELNNRTINLHTRLKGKIKWMGGKKSGIPVFEESEKDIKDEDLRELRKLSRELDQGTSPYRCIVSVLMLREGWDVRNVTTSGGLRAYAAAANIALRAFMGQRSGPAPEGPPTDWSLVLNADAALEHGALAGLISALSDDPRAAVAGPRLRFPDGRFHCLDIAAGLGTLSEGGFDLVTCCDVLFHVVDDRDFERAVGNLARLLADDGTLILMDNLLPGPTQRTAHQTSRSESHYLRTLSDAGLELRRRRPVFCLMNYPVASRRPGLRRLWSASAARLSRAEVLGSAVGAALYPLELACLACLGRTGGAPSTELLVCVRRPRRPSSAAGVVATGPG